MIKMKVFVLERYFYGVLLGLIFLSKLGSRTQDDEFRIKAVCIANSFLWFLDFNRFPSFLLPKVFKFKVSLHK